jgi:hypothetical protein
MRDKISQSGILRYNGHLYAVEYKVSQKASPIRPKLTYK